jgi:hypothetical protein
MSLSSAQAIPPSRSVQEHITILLMVVEVQAILASPAENHTSFTAIRNLTHCVLILIDRHPAQGHLPPDPWVEWFSWKAATFNGLAIVLLLFLDWGLNRLPHGWTHRFGYEEGRA